MTAKYVLISLLPNTHHKIIITVSQTSVEERDVRKVTATTAVMSVTGVRVGGELYTDPVVSSHLNTHES